MEQTDSDFEWIVVDGGSNDGTREWLEREAPPGCIWSTERDRGVFDAMNKGLDRSRGRYVLFLNGGDTFATRETLASVHAALRDAQTPPDLIYGDSIDVQPNGTALYRAARTPKWIRFGMFTSHQAMFFRIGRRPGLRHDLRFPISGDYAFVATFLDNTAGRDAPSYLALPIPICKFALGGQHFQKRVRGMREDFVIRREMLHQSTLLAGGLWCAHNLHHRLKVSLPRIMQRLRYADSQPPGAKPR